VVDVYKLDGTKKEQTDWDCRTTATKFTALSFFILVLSYKKTNKTKKKILSSEELILEKIEKEKREIEKLKKVNKENFEKFYI